MLQITNTYLENIGYTRILMSILRSQFVTSEQNLGLIRVESSNSMSEVEMNQIE